MKQTTTQALQTTLRDKPFARWSALAVVSLTMMCGYFLTDIISPLEDLLKSLGWTASEYGFFSGSYGYINVFLLMLFFGGIILDKMGIRFTGIMSTALMLIGVCIKYWAFCSDFGDQMLFGMHAQVVWASLGFAIFGVGAEITGITVSKVIVKWFQGKELALALGLQVATARLGTAAAFCFSLPIAKAYGGAVSSSVLLGIILLIIGFLSYLVYVVMDKKLDTEQASLQVGNSSADQEEGFKFSDVLDIFVNPGFWLIALLCLVFYSAVFPFLKFATRLMIDKYHVSQEFAGVIPSLLPFGTILLTPIFGSIYDKIGKGVTLMSIGAAMLTIVHVAFALPVLNYTWFAVCVMLILGVAFSLVPSAMWPSVPKIIPLKQLGTAYAIIFFIQNIGLSLVPWFIGLVNQAFGNYSVTMSVFAIFGFIAIILTSILRIVDKKEGYGLQLPSKED